MREGFDGTEGGGEMDWWHPGARVVWALQQGCESRCNLGDASVTVPPRSWQNGQVGGQWGAPLGARGAPPGPLRGHAFLFRQVCFSVPHGHGYGLRG